MNPTTLIYFAPRNSTFVAKDVDILSKHYVVHQHNFLDSRFQFPPLLLLQQLLFIIRFSKKSSCMIVMFGGYHAVLPSVIGKALRKRVYIILGGTDCVSFPSINYGTFRKKLQSKMTCLSFRLATKLLPVHESLLLRRNSYYIVDSEFQGLRFWCSHLQAPISVIPNGYESTFWAINSKKKIPNTFITIASFSNLGVAMLKGIDLILELATALPNCQFTIIGQKSGTPELQKLHNVKVIPYLPSNHLRQYLEASRYYFQLSISEGFPNALCEAMLSECIPIGSNVASIPEIIGETGYILKHRSSEQLLNLVLLALKHPDPDILGKYAKERIESKFTVNLRESLLLSAIA